MRRFSGWITDRDNWPILLIPLLLMAWARFGALELGLASFDSATLYSGPYRGPLTPGPGGEPIVPRVVIVVVDGLRVDTSRELPFLNEMRAAGSDRTMRVGEPSLSFPGWTLIGTGAWQEASGIASNYVDRGVEIDSLFRAVGREGGTRVIVGSPGWDLLFGHHADRVITVEGPAETDEAGLEVVLRHDRRILEAALGLLDDPPDLLLVHFPAVDTAGHVWGADSAEYRRAAAAVDEWIRLLADGIDASATALFVTADHGHLDPGGHAGPEPEVLHVPLVGIGAGVRPGVYPMAAQADLAPTVAALLGTSIPAHNQGRLLSDQIAADVALLARRAVDTAEQVSLRYEHMIEIVSGSSNPWQMVEAARQALAEGRYAAALQYAGGAVAEAESRWESARSDRLNDERTRRGAVALGLLIPVVLYGIWWTRRRWNFWAPALGAVVYLASWNANYHLLQRLTYSASWFNTDADIEPFLTARVIEALIASAVAVLLVAVLRRKARGRTLARDAAHTLLLIGVALMVQILAFYVWWGVTFTWHLPDFSHGFKYYLDVFQTTAAWPMPEVPAAAILVALAPIVGWLVHTIEGGFRRTASGG